jgi:hypothetical protein
MRFTPDAFSGSFSLLVPSRSDQIRNGVEPQPIDALIEPIPHDAVIRALDVRIVEIQIGLIG